MCYVCVFLYAEVVVGDDVHILRLLQNGSSTHFELKWKPISSQPKPSTLPVSSSVPSLQHTASPLPTISQYPFVPPQSHSLDRSTTGQDLIDGLSSIEFQKGKLRLHSELIEALREFTTMSTAKGSQDVSTVTTREGILEQALVEQNEILDVMQELIETLESESKFDKDKVSAQSKVIQDLSRFESRALKAERQLRELRNSIGTSTSGAIPYAAIAGFEKSLAQKDQIIASLQSKLDSVALEYRLKELNQPSSAPRLNSTRAKLEAERVRVIELEEELSSRKEEIEKLKREVAENKSVLLSKESEVLHFRHELESLKKFGIQQQELVMRQHTTLKDKDLQLASLTRALSKEKKVADQLRKTQQPNGSNTSLFLPKVADSSSHQKFQLFEQVMGRGVHAVELTRQSSDSNLGFSFKQVDLPVSSKLSCLVVKAVQERSAAFGVVKPGDEILEVNGYLCRSPDQQRAVECLEQTVGVIKLVLARDQEILFGARNHSTPVKTPHKSELWATALTSPVSEYKSFTRVSSLRFSEASSAEFVSILSDSESSETPSVNGTASHNEPGDQPKQQNKQNDSMIYEEDLDQDQLRHQLDESEHLLLRLQEELEAVQTELDDVQLEHKLTVAENYDLHQQVTSHEEEMVEIQQHVSELQSTLLALETQLTDEQQKVSSLENLNKVQMNESLGARESMKVTKKEKDVLSVEVAKLKVQLKEHTEEERKRLEDYQKACSERDQHRLEVADRDSEIGELKSKLEQERKEHEEVMSEMKQQNKALQSEVSSMKETSVKSASSSQEELQHLQAQLSSAKTLLMENEMKEAQLRMEMRYLKQAANLANKQLSDIEDDYKLLRGEVGMYKHVAEEKTLEIESLMLGLKAAKGKLTTNQDILTRLQGDIDNLRRNNAKLQTEKTQTEDAKNQLQSKLKAAESELAHLEEKLQESINEKDGLFQELEMSVLETTQLQGELDEVKSKLIETENLAWQSKVELEAQVKTLSEISRLEDASRQLDEERLHQIETLKSKNESLSEEVSALKTAKSLKERELESSQKKCDNVTEQCSKYKEENKQLESSLRSLQKELEESSEELERLNANRQDLNQQLTDLNDRCKQMNSELDQKDQDLRRAMAAQAQLEEDLKTEKGRVEELNATITTVTSQSTQFQKKKKQSEDMVASFEFMRQQTDAKMEQLQESLKKREEDVKRLNAEVKESTGQLQKSKSKNVGLEVSLSELKRHLEELKNESEAETAHSKETIAALNQVVDQLREELKNHKSEVSKQQATVKQLQSNLEHSNNERSALQKQIDQLLKEKAGTEAQTKHLEGQVTQLKSELNQMEDSSNSLSSESSVLRQQLKQTGRQVDELSAQLQAKEMNLDVVNRSFNESEQFVLDYKSRVESLELQLQEAQNRLKLSKEELEKTALEAHAKDELLSKHQANIELHQQKLSQLEYSLIEAQSNAVIDKEQSETLEKEKQHLQQTVEQLQNSEQKLKSSLLNLEREKLSEVEKWKSEAEQLRYEVQEYSTREEATKEEMVRLKRSESEARSTVEQLLAAQGALKQSLSTLGDEKDVEIMKLGSQVLDLETTLASTKKDLSSSRSNEADLDAKVKQLEDADNSKIEEKKLLEQNNTKLRQELELNRATESHISDLHSKVTELQEGLRTKNERLGELEESSQHLETELKTTQAENAGLLSKVTELATLKVSLAEMQAEMDKLRGDLQKETRTHKETSAERDQLLTMLRKLEVEKHTQVIQQPSPKLQKSESNKDQLLKLVKEKEEEAYRLKEYVGKLLSNVVEKAPFVLENMT